MEQAVPIIEIAFRRGMWWGLPPSMSRELYEKYIAGEQDIGYTWDWGDSRYGSWCPDGEKSSINRYLLDWERMKQTNIDKKRERSFRVAWVLPEQSDAAWTGEIVS